MEIARHAPPLKRVPELPHEYQRVSMLDGRRSAIDFCVPEWVTGLKRLFHFCQGAGAQLAGSFVVGEDELAVVNSREVSCYSASTISGAKLVTMYRKLSGFASETQQRDGGIDLDALLERSLKQCLHRQEPVTLPMGAYEVILEPEAVGELVLWLGYIAFGAKAFQERTSFLTGRIGERVMSPRITITDDGNDPAGLALPFDFEGTPKRKVALIDHGTAAGIVYDSTYGLLYGQPSTGHALPPDEVEGPLPLNLFMAAGATPREELIRSCKKGLLIPRFHYVNGLLNPREALMTGLTREGAFLIKDGKVTAPITTMRFTQSLLEAFRHVIGISKERQLITDPAQEGGSVVVPTLRLERFRFTGRSAA